MLEQQDPQTSFGKVWKNWNLKSEWGGDVFYLHQLCPGTRIAILLTLFIEESCEFLAPFLQTVIPWLTVQSNKRQVTSEVTSSSLL